MQRHQVRAGALAIGRAGRLVFARGYTFAEPGYPVTEPHSLFRVASCSKVLTATAVHRELARGRGLDLASRLTDELPVQEFRQSHGLSGHLSGGLFEDREGVIWIGTTKGLDSMSRGKGVKLPLPTLENTEKVLVAGDGGGHGSAQCGPAGAAAGPVGSRFQRPSCGGTTRVTDSPGTSRVPWWISW